MKDILNIYKPIGKTPYELVKKVKEVYPNLSTKKIGYAGRLDPMAHGVLLLLVGEVNKRKKEFESLPKEYVFDVLFGLETDSFDLLGKVTSEYIDFKKKDFVKNLKKEIKKYKGIFLQAYPPYSAIRLNGKPLYYWERRGILAKDSIPKKEITIQSLQFQSIGSISSENLHTIIKKRISGVSGDFRQKEILKIWDNFFQKNTSVQFMTAQFRLHCSSGTYVRSIVDDLGKKLGCGATTLSILRLSVGRYNLKQSIIM